MKVKLEKSDKKEAEVKSMHQKVNKASKMHRTDQEKRKIIRSLVKKNEKIEKIDNVENTKLQFSKKTIIVALLLLLLAIVLYQLKFGSCEFWAAYNKNFNKIVYGDENYCFKNIDEDLMSDRIRQQVIGQCDAIKLIQGSLKLANREGFVQIAFSGPVGVGKSLVSEIISENFPWKKNVQKYIWNQQPIDLATIKESKLSKCGFNLIIIDDVKVEDVEFISSFENDLRQVSKREEYRVILIIIFKSIITENVKNKLQQFVIIEFNSFTQDLYIACIQMHKENAGIKILPANEMHELMEINYTESGCKLVSKRLNLISPK